MTSAQVVETSVNVITNSPSQDYTHLDDHTLPTYQLRLLTRPKLLLNIAKLNRTVFVWGGIRARATGDSRFSLRSSRDHFALKKIGEER